MIRNAVISNCDLYRYALSRCWDPERGYVLFVMLNPSTADAEIDDPTIRRCIGFAKAWGYGGLMVGNLYAFRATDPTKLLDVIDPFGNHNIEVLSWMAAEAACVVLAWGGWPASIEMGCSVAQRLEREVPGRLGALGWTLTGGPRHPLYLRKDLRPEPVRTAEMLERVRL